MSVVVLVMILLFTLAILSLFRAGNAVKRVSPIRVRAKDKTRYE